MTPRRTAWAAIAVLLAGLAALLWAAGSLGAPPAIEPVDPPQIHPTGEDAALGATARVVESVARRVEVPAGEPTEERDFAWFLARIVASGVRTSQAIGRQDQETVAAHDRNSRSLLAELRRAIPDPEVPAFGALLDAMAEDRTLTAKVQRKICVLLIAEGLEARHRQVQTGAPAARLDDLLAMLLDGMPQDEEVAEGVAGLLADKPFLQLAQEPAVLDLVAMVPEHPHLRAATTRLLLTLWRNLEASGTRSAVQLGSLALLFAEDANPSRRLAAFEALLTLEGGRYRQLVLDEVQRRQDRELAEELVTVAARMLPPQEAIAILDSIGDLASRRMMGASLTLAHKNPAVIRSAFEGYLADDVHPNLRAGLIAGIGHVRDQDSRKLTLFAWRHDPSMKVRGNALLALTGAHAASHGREAIAEALGDLSFASDPDGQSYLASAVFNLANNGQRELAREFGALLLARSDLNTRIRREVQETLSQSLPAGGR